jgi:CHASE3 domain sensor protein
MESKAEQITTKIATFNKKNSLKLYCDIFMLLTKDNTLNNFSKNNSGIRFKLHEFEDSVLDKLLDLINKFESSNKNNTSFLDETIKSKNNTKKKVSKIK